MSLERYYSKYDEQNRLLRHWLEFEVTLKHILAYLGPPSASVVDVGGGPGRYAIQLGRLGYQVTLLDIVPAHVEQARTEARKHGVVLADAEVADARNLSSVGSERFDAALLLGPLYHLIDVRERRAALSEAHRVLKPGGLLFAAWLTRYASLRNVFAKDPNALGDPAGLRAEQDILRTGCSLLTDDEGNECPWYFEDPHRAATFVENSGFERLCHIGVEGVAAEHERHWGELSSAARRAVVDLTVSIGHEEAALSCSSHVLFIGKKIHA